MKNSRSMLNKGCVIEWIYLLLLNFNLWLDLSRITFCNILTYLIKLSRNFSEKKISLIEPFLQVLQISLLKNNYINQYLSKVWNRFKTCNFFPNSSKIFCPIWWNKILMKSSHKLKLVRSKHIHMYLLKTTFN